MDVAQDTAERFLVYAPVQTPRNAVNMVADTTKANVVPNVLVVIPILKANGLSKEIQMIAMKQKKVTVITRNNHQLPSTTLTTTRMTSIMDLRVLQRKKFRVKQNPDDI